MSEIKETKPSSSVQKAFFVHTGYRTYTYHIDYDETTKVINGVTLQAWIGEEQKEIRITNLDLRAILELMKEYGFKLTEEGGEPSK